MNRRKLQRIFHGFAQLFFVVGKAAARTAERKCRTKHNRIADLFACLDAFFNGVRDDRRQHRLADAFAKLLEQLSVLSHFDAGGRRTEKLDTAFFERSAFFELHGKIETGLAAQTRNERVGMLPADDFCKIVKR